MRAAIIEPSASSRKKPSRPRPGPSAKPAVLQVARTKQRLRGYRMVAAPKVLRHFTARFAPLAEP